jgi:proteasome lid subunit RPN8/RPN11
MIAVPCWSSWKTGIFMRSRSCALDVEALRRLDVLEVDAAEGRLQRRHHSIMRRGRPLVDLDVEHIDAGEFLEQDRLAFHHRLGSERPMAPRPSTRGAVGDDADEVAARRAVSRAGRPGPTGSAAISSSQAARDARRIGQRQVALVAERLGRVFAGLFLDSQHRVLAAEELSHGTLDAASVYPREVVKRALALGAAAVIFAHNHPSGMAEPSAADRILTDRLKQALSLVDVRVLDHFVVGEGVPTSFAERGWI